MFCSNCGHNFKAGAAFCDKCGAKMQSVGTPANSGNLIMGLHKQRAAVLFASIVGGISLFLPWVASPFFGTQNIFAGLSPIFIIGILAFFVFTIVEVLRGKTSEQLAEKDKKEVIGFGITGVVIGILTIIIDIPRGWQAREGVFLFILASGAIAVCAYVLEEKTTS